MNVEYKGHGREDFDQFPVGSARVLPAAATWNIRPDTADQLRGGTATIHFQYLNHPERRFTFQIRGTNPNSTVVKARLGSSPWFLTRIVMQESTYRQFNNGEPHWGSPNGWGLMQLDPPPGPQVIWSWWANVDAGKQVLAQKSTQLNSFWNSQINQWTQWNQNNPTQQVGPPAPRTEGGCQFVWAGGGSGTENEKSFRDAIWIKRYNGAGNGDFIFWENRGDHANAPFWDFNPTGSDGRAYVAAVCSHAP